VVSRARPLCHNTHYQCLSGNQVNNNDNEFGPGIYTANDFDTAASYACPNGAIMIFGLTLWKNESESQDRVECPYGDMATITSEQPQYAREA
jgi:hypothetical protein